MKKLSLVAVSFFVMGFVVLSMSARAAEHGGATMEEKVQVVGDDTVVVKEAWTAVKDTNPELAGKLEKIVNGDKTNASGTLTEASQAVKGSNPDLAAKLEKLAESWAQK